MAKKKKTKKKWCEKYKKKGIHCKSCPFFEKGKRKKIKKKKKSDLKKQKKKKQKKD